MWRVVQSRPFQRLRRIKQLGFSDLVYPGASHSRLVHSLGVFHTARQLMGVINRANEIHQSPSRENRAIAAALVHDLGHGPFSHAFEKVGERLGLKLADHELVSDALIRNGEVAEILNGMGSGFASDVADIIKGEGNITVHNAVVSSQFDADRLDYMRRDRLMSGSEHAAIDFTWLINNLEIGTIPTGVDEQKTADVNTFVLGSKAVYAAEAYVLGLFQLYPTVYFHKATRCLEKIFTEIFIRIVTLSLDNSSNRTGLPQNHPILRFVRDPENLDTVLNLDDSVIWGALPLLTDSNDPVVAKLASRLRDRKLFKCIDIRSRVVHELDPTSRGTPDHIDKIDRCCEAIKEKLTERTDGQEGELPTILLDEATRSPYKRNAGLLGRINIRTEGGELVDLKERSQVVASLKDFRLLRTYHDENDVETLEFINSVILREVSACQ